MANTPYYGNLTKVHMGGVNSDEDIHLEIYQNEVDTRFQYSAIFLGLSSQRSVAHQSNTYRFDRLNTTSVKSRKSGEALDSQKVTNEKCQVVVDTTLYIRNPIDYQDDWTAPDWLAEIGQNNGSEFAEFFDTAHLIQIIKNRKWKPNADVADAFSDAVTVTATFKSDAMTQAELEANAISVNEAHKRIVTQLVKNKVPLNDMVTLVTPEIYSALIEHPKLLNVEFDVANGGEYSGRRVARLNGIPVVEVTCYPDAATPTGKDHPLGPQFNVTAEDMKVKMVVFSRSRGLLTVEACPFTSRIWDDKLNFANVLDCYAMYTVGARNPSTFGAVEFSEPTPTP